MNDVAFGRVVDLITDKAGPTDFKIGLEAIEGGTGRLISGIDGNYEGDGIAFAPGDVLFGKLRPHLAKTWLADRVGAAVGDFHVYRPQAERLDARYLQYVTLASSFLDPVISSVYGAKMPRASWDFVRNIPLHLPPLAEQRAIADYLDHETAKIDALIGKQEDLVDLFDRRIEAVIQRLALRSDAFAELRGDEARSHQWRTGQLRRVGGLVNGTTPSGEPSTLFASDGVLGWVTPEDLRRQTEATRWLSPEGVRQVRPVEDAVLICCIGATVGKVGFAVGAISTNQQVTALVGTGCPTYWYYVLRALRSVLVAAAAGNTLPILNNSRLASLEVPIPPTDVQRRIVADLDDEVSKSDELVNRAARLISLAKERRAALITAAVAGELDVRTAA